MRAAELNPAFAEAHNNLGNVLFRLHKFTEAITCYRVALERHPDYAVAHFNLGNVLVRQRKETEGIDCFRKAIALRPDFAEAHCNLGNALVDQGRLVEAVDCYRRAIAFKPDLAEAHNSLGIALREKGFLDDAVVCFRQALRAKPNYPEAHSNLGGALKNLGRLHESIAHHRRAIELTPESGAAHGSFLYTLSFSPSQDAAAIYEQHRRWNDRFAESLRPTLRRYANDRAATRRLKIAYVSPDFRNHVLSHFLVPLFRTHDHAQFEVIAYADLRAPDAITEKLRESADGWRDIAAMTHDQVAELVREDQIDILVDLTMHMANNRLLVFARKPAPVQVTWLAYPGTTGLTAIDYRLTDPYLDPPGLFDQFYSEESVRLADTFWCYDPLTTEPAVNALPALDKGYVTFGSLNNFCKVNDGVLKLWARVLNAVDRSRLVLLAPEGACRQQVIDVFQQEGVAAERIDFVAFQPRPQYLQVYHRIDIGLDTFPYNGHTTSLDALWMGVPVVTLVGQTVVGRAGLSQLTNLNLTDLIAHTPDQFVQIASGLAADLPRLAALRAELRSRMERSPLMDAPRFARSIESAYRTLWQRWCNSK